MKKIISFLMMAVTMAFAANAAEIGDILANFNKDLPAQFGPGNTLDKVVAADNQVIYNFTIDESQITFETVEAQADMFKSVFVAETVSSPDKDMQALRKFCVDNNWPIIYRFKGTKSGKVLDIVLDVESLK